MCSSAKDFAASINVIASASDSTVWIADMYAAILASTAASSPAAVASNSRSRINRDSVRAAVVMRSCSQRCSKYCCDSMSKFDASTRGRSTLSNVSTCSAVGRIVSGAGTFAASRTASISPGIDARASKLSTARTTAVRAAVIESSPDASASVLPFSAGTAVVVMMPGARSRTRSVCIFCTSACDARTWIATACGAANDTSGTGAVSVWVSDSLSSTLDRISLIGSTAALRDGMISNRASRSVCLP